MAEDTNNGGALTGGAGIRRTGEGAQPSIGARPAKAPSTPQPKQGPKGNAGNSGTAKR